MKRLNKALALKVLLVFISFEVFSSFNYCYSQSLLSRILWRLQYNKEVKASNKSCVTFCFLPNFKVLMINKNFEDGATGRVEGMYSEIGDSLTVVAPDILLRFSTKWINKNRLELNKNGKIFYLCAMDTKEETFYEDFRKANPGKLPD